MKNNLPLWVGLLAAMTAIGVFNAGTSHAAALASLFDGKTLGG